MMGWSERGAARQHSTGKLERFTFQSGALKSKKKNNGSDDCRVLDLETGRKKRQLEAG